MMNELQTYIAAKNAESLAWYNEDPENRCVGLTVEDVAFWNEQGIYTVEQFERSMLIDSISDTYKDVHGCRPCMDYSAMSVEQLKEVMAGLDAYRNAENEQEEQEIADVCKSLGITRETYDRWHNQQYDDND